MNIKPTKEELDLIRSLPDFDLIQFLSEMDDFGWHEGGRLLLPMICESVRRERGDTPMEFKECAKMLTGMPYATLVKTAKTFRTKRKNATIKADKALADQVLKAYIRKTAHRTTH